MPTLRHRHGWRWILIASLAWASPMVGCGKSGKSPRPTAKDAAPAPPVRPAKTPLQKEIDKALVLESALDKAKAALAEAEQATPRDEALIAERADGVKAIEESIKRSRQMIEVLRARQP